MSQDGSSSPDVGLSMPPSSEKWRIGSTHLFLSAGDEQTSTASENLCNKLSLSFSTPSTPSFRKPLEKPCLTSEPHQISTRRTILRDDPAGDRKDAGMCPVKSAGRSWIVQYEQKPAIDDYAPLESFIRSNKPFSSLQPRRRNTVDAKFIPEGFTIGSSDNNLIASSSSAVLVDDVEPLPFYRPARPADTAALKNGPAAESQSADEPLQPNNNVSAAGKADHHPQAFLSKYEITKSCIATGSTCYVMEVKVRPARGVDRVLDDGMSSEPEGNKDSVESPSLMVDKANHQTSSYGDDDSSDERYACKVITVRTNDAQVEDENYDWNSMASESRKDVLKELEVLKQLSSHRRILQLRDVFWSDCGDSCYIITSLAKGGSLQDKVWSGGPGIDEEVAKTAMQQVLEGIAFMHGKGFVHRDLKLSNIVINTADSKGSDESSEPSAEFQIADFGMSKHLPKYGGSRGKHTICGSPSCVAPELLECPHVCQWSGKIQAQYGRKIDIWSCGVMLFTMLSGKEPFTGEGIGDLFRSIKIGHIDISGPVWAEVSEEAKDFVRLLLTTNPAKRPTAEEALAHAWIATGVHL